MEAADPPKCPVDGCTLPVNICLRSSDGVLIGAHTRNLETFSDAFPSTSLSAPPSEPVTLTETAVVLQLLMHFMHNVRQPSLEEKPFDLVLGFAEAVEKYGVHAADQLCWLKMRDHIPNHALGVLNFGVRHNLEDLVKLAAPETIRYSFSAVVQAMSSDPVLLARWADYCQHWEGVFNDCLARPEMDPWSYEADYRRYSHIDDSGQSTSEDCVRFYRFYTKVCQEMMYDGRSSLLDAKKYIDENREVVGDCYACDIVIERWLDRIQKEVGHAKQHSF